MTGAVLVLATVVWWSRVWPYLLLAAALGGLAVLAWFARRRLAEVRRKEALLRAEQRIREANRTLKDIDTLSGEDFERQVAAMLRESGCTEVERVGGRGDRGRDVHGVLPDGRSLLVQCKRYAPKRSVGSGDMQRLLGARTDFGADVAVLVTTARFTADAERYARENGLVAIGRNLLATWLNGAAFDSLLHLGGGGQGNRRHLTVWQKTYGDPSRPRRRKPSTG